MHVFRSLFYKLLVSRTVKNSAEEKDDANGEHNKHALIKE